MTQAEKRARESEREQATWDSGDQPAHVAEGVVGAESQALEELQRRSSSSLPLGSRRCLELCLSAQDFRLCEVLAEIDSRQAQT
eukprot:2475040-Rhodomonas_salina.5